MRPYDCVSTSVSSRTSGRKRTNTGRTMIAAKVLVVLCAVCSISYSKFVPPQDLQDELLTPIHETCTKRLSVTDDDVNNYNLATNTPDMKCYMKCLMLEADWMNSDLNIDYERIYATAHPAVADIIKRAVSQCTNIDKGNDACDLAYNFNVCLEKADSENWFLP